MKKFLSLTILLISFSAIATAQCTAPVLTPIGIDGQTWKVDVQLTKLTYPDGSQKDPCMFELCYSRKGITLKVQSANSLSDPMGFTGTNDGTVWYAGAAIGDSIWVNQYCIPVPFYLGPYFTALYNDCKADTANWVKGKAIRLEALPGASSGPFVSPAKGKKK